VVSVVDQPSRWLSLGDRHVEGVQDQLGAQVVGHRPADDPTGEGVQDDRQVQPAIAGALLGDVGHPQPVRSWWGEVALDQVRCRGGLWVAARQPVPPAPMAALEASGAHQPGHAFAAHVHLQAQPQLGVHARGAIGPAAVGMDLADLVGERLVSHGPLRRRPARPGVIARTCHTQHAGQTGDSVVGFLLIDQPIAAHR
jgi:hypothetical protein